MAWRRVALVALVCAGSVSAQKPARGVAFFSTNLQATLEPCGCTQAMRGGLARIATLIAQERATGAAVHYYDANDALFATPTLLPVAVPQARAKAQAVARALRTIGLEARMSSVVDDALGRDFRASLKLPELKAPAVRFFQVGDAKVAVAFARDYAAASAQARLAKAGGAAFVIAMVDVGPEVFPAEGGSSVDLAIAIRPPSGRDANRLSATSPRVAQLETQGKSLLRVDFRVESPEPIALAETGTLSSVAMLNARIEMARASLNAPQASAELKTMWAAKLKELIARRDEADASSRKAVTGNVAAISFVSVEASVPETAAVKRIVDDYAREVSDLNLAWAESHGEECSEPSADAPGVVGTATCGGCHPAALQAWKESPHQHAYEALVKVQKQFHLDCVACHVTGWQTPGGVCRVDRVTARAHVGCEACHGAGSAHAQSPQMANIRASPSSSVCVQCHDATNSPSFDFEKYVKVIKVPGHGLPLTQSKN